MRVVHFQRQILACPELVEHFDILLRIFSFCLSTFFCLVTVHRSHMNKMLIYQLHLNEYFVI
jgi:hypothetical protein